MSWKPEVDEIRRRRERAAEQGGPRAVEQQHALGRWTARERIAALLDPDSFREHGALAGAARTDAGDRLEEFTPAGVVVGSGLVDGRRVVVGADDFTIRGGAYTPASLKKGLYADELALRRRLPLVRLLEGGGASIAGAAGTRGRSGYDFTAPARLNQLAVETLSSVPVVCAALGPVAGYPAGRLVASHFSVMTRRTAQVLTGGPALVQRALGDDRDKQELGGAQVHERSGVVDNVADDEAHALALVRGFLSYLPSHAWELAPRMEIADPPDRREDELVSLVPRERRRVYKVRRLIELVVDQGSFFELTPLFGRSQVTGLARVAGHSVGVLANDGVHDGGAMTADGARKVRRFVELCDGFHLPIVSFVDEPGFMIGAEAERSATIRHGMAALFAVQQSRVPWFSVLVRKAFGVAQGIHLGPGGTVVAWPSARSGALPVEAGVALAFRREIEASSDPEARRAELEDEMDAAQEIWPRAEEFGVHDLIDPAETRPLLCEWLDEIQGALSADLGPARYTIRP